MISDAGMNRQLASRSLDTFCHSSSVLLTVARTSAVPTTGCAESFQAHEHLKKKINECSSLLDKEKDAGRILKRYLLKVEKVLEGTGRETRLNEMDSSLRKPFLQLLTFKLIY